MLAPLWLLVREFVGFLTVRPDLPLSDHAPNLWSIIQAVPVLGALPFAGLGMAAAVGAAASIIAGTFIRPGRRTTWLSAALLVTLAVPGLLPHMGGIDFLPALLIAGTIAGRQRDHDSIHILILIAAGVALAITGIDTLAMLGAVPMIAATLLVAKPFLASPANNNGLPLNPLAIYPA